MFGQKFPQNPLDGYKKRQQVLPLVIGIMAVLLVIIGVVIIVMWFTGGGLSSGLFQRRPTATNTQPPTPLMSPTASLAPSLTPTPEPSVTPTPSGPFEYEVKENDNCWSIADKFKVDLFVMLAINNFPNGTCPIIPGQKILVPAPGMSLPTSTPIPSDMPPGTKVNYIVQAGDSLGTIASKFNTTIDDIVNQNKTKLNALDDLNNIPVGLELVIRVNIVTPTPTFAPTSTRAS